MNERKKEERKKNNSFISLIRVAYLISIAFQNKKIKCLNAIAGLFEAFRKSFRNSLQCIFEIIIHSNVVDV